MSGGSMTVSIPRQDMIEFAALPDAVKVDVMQWIDVLRTVLTADKPAQAIEEQERVMMGVRGFSAVSIRRKYQAFKQTRDWRCLVNGAKLPGQAKKLPDDFLEYWRGKCERNQRKCKAAYRELVAEWRAGRAIPGYRVSPLPGPGGIPEGWTYGNLMRHKPTRYELKAARIGRSAAAVHRPKVLTTRVGLQPGQHIMFDDVEHDAKVNMLGVNSKAMRPLELAALDVFSGCKFAWGMKPMLWNEVEEKKEKLKDREMRFLLAYVLTRYGYRPDGTTLYVEHGTAAITETVERALHESTQGAVTVNRSGIEGDAAFSGHYRGRGKGNFRFKAALESHHNLSHNELANLPGQMGKDRDHSPEELYGRDKHNQALIKAMAALPPERAELLRLPFLEFGQYQDVCYDVYRAINDRIDHDLEGWEEAGLIAHEWRVNQEMPWLPMAHYLELPPAERGAVKALLDSSPELTRVRKLSPAEVWERGANELTRLQGHCIPMLLGKDLAVERTVRDSVFEFQDRDIGPGVHTYLAEIRTKYRVPEMLKEGETYLTYINPFDSSMLHVCDSKGGYLGACAKWQRIRRDDVDSLHRQMGRAASIESKLLTPVAKRGADLTRKRIADARHNAAVLKGEPITREEREYDDLVRSTRVSQKDLAAARAGDPEEDGDDFDFTNEEISAVLTSGGKQNEMEDDEWNR